MGLFLGRILMEKRLGPTCFDDEHVGRFWDILDTRPYMRVLQTRVRFQFMMEKYRDAAYVDQMNLLLALIFPQAPLSLK